MTTFRSAVWLMLVPLSLLAAVGPLNAQTSSPGDSPVISFEVREQYKRAIERTINMDLVDFRKVMPPEQQAMLAQIRYIVSSSDNFYEVYASNSTSGREIHISVGFIVSIELVEDAALFASVFKVGGRDEVLKYINYVKDRFVSNVKRYKEGNELIPAVPYLTFLGLRPDRISQLYDDEKFQNLRVQMKIDTIALILGHELGHHMLRQLDPGNELPRGLSDEEHAKRQSEREAAADDFGIALSNKSGHSTMMSAWPFLFFGVLEEGTDPKLSDHPWGLCRFAKALKAGVDDALENPTKIRRLGSDDEQTLQDFRTGINALMQSGCASDTLHESSSGYPAPSHR